MTLRPTPKQIVDALLHAEACQPLEACGVIAGGHYFRLTNTATDHDTFVMDMRGFIAIARTAKVEAIVHSHIYLPPEPSEGDMAMCEKTGLPWLIVSWPTGKHRVIEPSGWTAPLVGRQWAWGSHDCWGLVRDALNVHRGILMPDVPREWLWWRNGGDLIVEKFEEVGLVRVPQDTPLRDCDILGMQIASPVVNHLGMYLAPDLLLHQLMGRISLREVYGGMYRKLTTLHLRHRDLMEVAA